MPGRLDVPYSGYNDPHDVREHLSMPLAPHVSPDMFGAQIARAGASLGENLEGIANKYAALNNEMGATERFTNSMQSMDNVWTEFAQLHGNDATSRLPEFKQKLSEAHDAGLEGIPNIVQKELYLRQSRMYLARQVHLLDAHAVQQNAAAIVKTTADAEQAFSDRAIINSDPGHEDGFDLFVNSVAGERKKQASYLGLNQASEDPNAPVPWEGHISSGVGKTVHEAVAYQLQNGHLDQANKIFEKYRGRMDGVSTVATMKLLHPANLQDQTGGWADHYMPWTAEGYTPPAGAGKIVAARGTTPVAELVQQAASKHGIDPSALSAFVRIESGGNPKAQTGNYYGLLQLEGNEFARHGGGDIFNPSDNLGAGATKLRAEADAFAEKYGRQATALDLYMIHQQGAGGYAAHAANLAGAAWQNMASTAEGVQKGAGWAKKAIWGNIPDDMKAQFGSVENVTSRDFIDVWRQKLTHFGAQPDAPVIGGGGPQQQPLGHLSIQQTLQQIYNNPEIRKNPELLRKLQTEIHQRYQAFDVTSAAQREDVTMRLAKLSQLAAQGQTDLTLGSVGLSEELVRGTLHPAHADTALERINTEMQLAHDVSALRFAPPEQVNKFLDGIGGTGEGLKFPHTKSSQDIAQAMAQDWLKRRQQDLADPAAFVAANPQVQEKFEARNRIATTGQAVLKSNAPQQIKDKVASDINDAWGRAVTTSLATQAYIGLPEEDRHVLTAADAKAMAKHMQTGETDIKTELDSLQKNSGEHWPRVLRDLVNLGGLSADAQALQMIPDTDASDLSWFLKQYSGKAKDASGQAETIDAQLKKALPLTSGVKDPVAEVRNLVLKDENVIAMQQSWRSTFWLGDATDTENQIANLTGAINKLAYARMLRYPHESATIAVGHAVHAFTDPWEFSRDGAMVPRGKSYILDNANAFLRTLPADQVSMKPSFGVNTPFGYVGGLTSEQHWEAVKAAPAWVTNPSHDGLWLTDANIKGVTHGVLMRKKDGSPIEWKFSQTLQTGAEEEPNWFWVD